MISDFKFVARHSAAQTEDYHLELDEYRRGADQMIIVHFRIHKWTPSVLKRIRREWPLFRSIVTCDLYATAQVETPEWHKFVKLFGFVPLIDVITVSGEPRKMYIHRVQSNPTRVNHGLLPAVN